MEVGVPRPGADGSTIRVPETGTMKGAQMASSAALLCGTATKGPASLQIPTISLRTPSPRSAGDDDDANAPKKSTAIEMPAIGMGTYKFKKGSGDAARAVRDAVHLGYRLVDTAFVYGGEQTEKEIGTALSSIFSSSSPPIARSDIFLTSKQWRAYHGYDATLRCLDMSLKRLQTDYLDLYLIHWPGPAYSTMARRKDVMEQSPHGAFVYAKEGHSPGDVRALRAETWRAMEDSLHEGKCHAIGVSNFTIEHLEALKRTARVWPPAVNQIELHPYYQQRELVEYCRVEGIVVQAYASLGGQDAGRKTWNALGGRLLEREEVASVAERHGKAPAQVLLRWATQQGYGVIPKSTNVEHMQLNLEAVASSCNCPSMERKKNGDNDMSKGDNTHFFLSDEEMECISSLDQSCVQAGNIGVNMSRNIINEKARLCWARDPLRMLNFE